jgi:hypothetical protein
MNKPLGFGWNWRWTLEKVAGFFTGLEEFFHSLTQGSVASASFVKVRGTLLAGQLARRIEYVRRTILRVRHNFVSHYPLSNVKNQSKRVQTPFTQSTAGRPG